jgi:hypothetical protein
MFVAVRLDFAWQHFRHLTSAFLRPFNRYFRVDQSCTERPLEPYGDFAKLVPKFDEKVCMPLHVWLSACGPRTILTMYLCFVLSSDVSCAFVGPAWVCLLPVFFDALEVDWSSKGIAAGQMATAVQGLHLISALLAMVSRSGAGAAPVLLLGSSSSTPQIDSCIVMIAPLACVCCPY